jgi:uncharacterized protein
MRKLGALVVAGALLVGACTSDSDDGNSARPAVDRNASTTEAPFTVVGGVQQVTVTGARPGQPLTLADPDGAKLLTLRADDVGQAVFTYLPDEHTTMPADGSIPGTSGEGIAPGDGYTVRDESTDPVELAGPFRVLAVDDHPPGSFYDEQRLDEGFGYVEMRDGVELSVMVRFPDPNLYGDGPWPTVVEYSGYSPSRPTSAEPGSSIVDLLGYATVGVNMRGTGCSGGVFDIFSPAQQADGYDMIEAIARQPWVLHNEVGMVGLSYSGISQLYTASTRPPSLAAITPLSVIEDPWAIQWPGGIYNSGFTKQWLAERDRQAAPGGQSWVTDLVEQGDDVCEANLPLRQQNLEFEPFARALENRPDAIDDRRLSLLVPNIEVPVYLTGAWQDEQTGPAFATMLDRFTATERKKFTMFNGRHPDGYSPMVLTRWYEFLEFYVAKRVPKLSPAVRALAPEAFEGAFGVPGLGFEPDRFPEFTEDDYDEALAAYEREPVVRVLFENGAAGPVDGAPGYRFEATFDTWPPPDVDAQRWYLGPDGTLMTTPPGTDGVDVYEFDPDAGSTPYTQASASSFISPIVPSDWTSGPPGTSLSYLTEPFDDDLVMAGPGHAELWFRTTESDAHVEVVVSIVQPDGTEYYVQQGLLRASSRSIDESKSTELFVAPRYGAAHRSPLPSGEWVELKVPIFPFAQVFRAGSRLHVRIDTPGRDTPLWEFENPEPQQPDSVYEVARSPERPSAFVLPVVRAFPAAIPEGFPNCPALRGQVCRPFQPTANRTAG